MSLDLFRPMDPVGSGRLEPRVLLVVCCRAVSSTGALELTLESLQEQREEPADIVLVAPVTATAVRATAAARGLQVIDDPGTGLAAAVNAGLAAAAAGRSYVSWLLAGDALLPGALAVAVAALEAHPAAVIAHGGCRFVDDEDGYLFTSCAGRRPRSFVAWAQHRSAQPAALFRSAAIRAAGGLDETLTHAATLALLLRLRQRGVFVDTERTLAVVRRPSAAERSAAAAEERSVLRAGGSRA
jgi:GT2 family glycosyltransferase